MSNKKKMFLFSFIILFTQLNGYAISYNGDRNAVDNDSLAEDLFIPEYNYEYVPDAPYELIEDRISCIDTDITLTYNNRIKSFIDYFTVRDRGYTKLMIQRMNLYFPLFEKYLKKHNLPLDLKYLAIVESGLNPRAISRVGAAGLWQFMPATGRSFKLNQDYHIDERLDPEKATEAACLYLKQLYRMFGDWEMALASYNCGPGNVRKAIRRSGYKDTFWEVYDHLPRETRSYVPQFIAIAYVMNYAEEHNFIEDEFEYPMEVDTVQISQYLDLKSFAGQINVCLEDLQNLNPELKRFAIPNDAQNYALKVPSDKYDFINTNKVALLDSASKLWEENQSMIAKSNPASTYEKEKIVYRVRSGDVLGKIASRHSVRIADIRKWNNINGNLIRAGQRLTIWATPSASSLSSQLAKSDSDKPIPVPDGVYLVQPGDTLWDISKKYNNLSIEKIKKLNNLTSNSIKAGQRLVLN